MKSWLSRAALAGVLLAVSAFGESSNRNEVRSNLESNGWQVVWGHNFTEGDWVEGTAAIAASASCECPAPFLQWFDYKLDQMLEHLQRSLSGVTKTVLKNWITQSLNQNRLVMYNGLQIQAGFATYDRWQDACINVPGYGRLCGGCVTVFGRRYCADKINLPNWHQFYIRFKLNGGGTPNPGTPGVGNPHIQWGKVCTVARRESLSDSYTYFAYNSNPSTSWDDLCDRARQFAREGSPGRAVTHFWKTTYDVNGSNLAIAECMNGTWRVTGHGFSAVQKINDVRKQNNGKGCLFKVQK
jgi:hypothetical protein